MTLDRVRERMAECLRQAGVDAVCAWPEETRTRRETVTTAVSLRACEGGPGGFQDYLGERWNESTGHWEELYGKKARLVFGLDLYAPRGAGAEAAGAAFDRMADALRRNGPEGLRVLELSCGETKYDRETGLFHCPVQAVCEGYLYAVADEGGAFLDFIVRGDGKL